MNCLIHSVSYAYPVRYSNFPDDSELPLNTWPQPQEVPEVAPTHSLPEKLGRNKLRSQSKPENSSFQISSLRILGSLPYTCQEPKVSTANTKSVMAARSLLQFTRHLNFPTSSPRPPRTKKPYTLQVCITRTQNHLAISKVGRTPFRPFR